MQNHSACVIDSLGIDWSTDWFNDKGFTMYTKTVGAYEAKTHLPALLDSVAAGERIIITRKGTPVAVLSRYEADKPSVDKTIKALLAFRKGRSLKGLSIKEMREEGRRF